MGNPFSFYAIYTSIFMKGVNYMFDFDTTEIFNELEELSLMNDEEFEKAKLEFKNNGLILKRSKCSGGYEINITQQEK